MSKKEHKMAFFGRTVNKVVRVHRSSSENESATGGSLDELSD
jgi:hypothetical protein